VVPDSQSTIPNPDTGLRNAAWIVPPGLNRDEVEWNARGLRRMSDLGREK